MVMGPRSLFCRVGMKVESSGAGRASFHCSERFREAKETTPGPPQVTWKIGRGTASRYGVLRDSYRFPFPRLVALGGFRGGGLGGFGGLGGPPGDGIGGSGGKGGFGGFGGWTFSFIL